MNPRKITSIVLIFASFLFGDDSIIDLKTFPRPTMNASLLNGDEIIFRLDKVTQLKTEVSDEEKASLKNFFLEDRAETELVTLQTSMQEASSVIVN